jgi:hypothetical protein
MPDAVLARLEGLTNLTHLDLHNTRVSDAGLAHLKGLTNLRELFLFGCPHVGDAGLANVGALTHLSVVDLNATRVTDAGLVHVKGLTDLTHLNLMSLRISGAGFAHLKGLPKLASLNLANSTVGDAGLAHLEGLTGLRDLVLADTRVTDAGLIHLKGLTDLTSLHLMRTGVSDAGLAHLKGLKNLTWLDLRKTKATAAGVQELRGALPNCKVEWDGVTQPAEVLTPAQAAGKVGQKVTVQFRVKGSGRNAGGIPQLYSEVAWNTPGCFFIRFLKPTCDKFRELGIPDVVRHFHGKLIRATGTVTALRFSNIQGSYPCIYINNPDEILVPDLGKTRTDGFGLAQEQVRQVILIAVV